MEQVGFSLIEISTNAEINFWGNQYGQYVSIPAIIVLPSGTHVHCPEVNVSYEGYMLVDRFFDDNSEFGSRLEDNKFIVNRAKPIVVQETLEDLKAQLQILALKIENFSNGV
jgi:hypothetical protein